MQFKNHQYYNCEVLLDNGDTYLVEADWIHRNCLDNWQGWICDAGYNRLSIDPDFNVSSAECNNQFLGNLFGQWQLNERPDVCHRVRCTGCTDDLVVGKSLADPESQDQPKTE